MTAPTHVYVTAHGKYTSGPWLGETAQFGLRLTVEAAATAPQKGEIYTPGTNGDAVADQGSDTGVRGTLTRTFSFRRGPVGNPEDWDSSFQCDIADDVWTFLDAIKVDQRSTFSWTHVKQSPVDAQGRAIMNSSVYTFTTPIAGTNAGGQLPPQCAIAISLRAPVIGRRGRGRFYLPALATAYADNDAILSTSRATNLRTYAKALVDNLQNVPGTPVTIPIVAIMSAASATAVRPTQVRTGNRIDTIRSRREQVAESYTGLDL